VEIRRACARGDITQKELALRYGVAQGQISRIFRRSRRARF
jgi:transcriptional regulator with XRE-family HTH domain